LASGGRRAFYALRGWRWSEIAGKAVAMSIYPTMYSISKDIEFFVRGMALK
jgi:hypothetical protein